MEGNKKWKHATLLSSFPCQNAAQLQPLFYAILEVREGVSHHIGSTCVGFLTYGQAIEQGKRIVFICRRDRPFYYKGGARSCLTSGIENPCSPQSDRSYRRTGLALGLGPSTPPFRPVRVLAPSYAGHVLRVVLAWSEYLQFVVDLDSSLL